MRLEAWPSVCVSNGVLVRGYLQLDQGVDQLQRWVRGRGLGGVHSRGRGLGGVNDLLASYSTFSPYHPYTQLPPLHPLPDHLHFYPTSPPSITTPTSSSLLTP